MTNYVGIRDSELPLLDSLEATDQVTILKQGPFRNRRATIESLAVFARNTLAPAVQNHEDRIIALEQEGGSGPVDEDPVYEYTMTSNPDCGSYQVIQFPLALIDGFRSEEGNEPGDGSSFQVRALLSFTAEYHELSNPGSVYMVDGKVNIGTETGSVRVEAVTLTSSANASFTIPRYSTLYLDYRSNEEQKYWVQVPLNLTTGGGPIQINGRVHYSGAASWTPPTPYGEYTRYQDVNGITIWQNELPNWALNLPTDALVHIGAPFNVDAIANYYLYEGSDDALFLAPVTPLDVEADMDYMTTVSYDGNTMDLNLWVYEIPEPEQPIARGFYVSNPMMAARTADFSSYVEVTDGNAPLVSPAAEATHTYGQEGEIVMFTQSGSGNNARLSVQYTRDGGTTWTSSYLPNHSGLFRGQQVAYFSGDYFIYATEHSTSAAGNAIMRGLFRLVNLGDDTFELERVADFEMAGTTVDSQNHVLSDGDRLYVITHLGSGNSRYIFLKITSDLLTWESVRITPEFFNSSSPDYTPNQIHTVSRARMRDGKLYLLGLNRRSLDNLDPVGLERFSYGVLDILNLAAGVTWRYDWAILHPNQETDANWAPSVVDIEVTDTHLFAMTDDITVNAATQNSVGSIMIKPIANLDAPWDPVYADSGITNGSLQTLYDRVVAFGQKSSYRPLAASVVYALSSDDGYQYWEEDTNSNHIFNLYDQSSYVAGFDMDLLPGERMSVPQAPDEILAPFLNGVQSPSSYSIVGVSSGGNIYIHPTGSFDASADGTASQARGLYRLTPYDGTERSPVVDTTFQPDLRVSTSSWNWNSRMNSLTAAVEDGEGRVYVSAMTNFYAYDGSGYTNIGRIKRLLSSGLHDTTFNPTLPHQVTHLMRNRRGNIMVWSNNPGTVNLYDSGDGQMQNNLMEIMPDGSMHSVFRCVIPGAAGRMTQIEKVWQTTSGYYVVHKTTDPRSVHVLTEDGALVTHIMDGANPSIHDVISVTDSEGEMKVLIVGGSLQGGFPNPAPYAVLMESDFSTGTFITEGDLRQMSDGSNRIFFTRDDGEVFVVGANGVIGYVSLDDMNLKDTFKLNFPSSVFVRGYSLNPNNSIVAINVPTHNIPGALSGPVVFRDSEPTRHPLFSPDRYVCVRTDEYLGGGA